MGYVITFAQQKGGAGKTTLLAHLAVAWAESDKTVALIDLDPQKSLSRWFDVREDPSIDRIESRDYRASSDMRESRKSHDVVLVDCPGAASGLLDNVIRETDVVVAPCQPSAMDIWASKTIVDTAKKHGTKCRILLNRVPPRLGELEDILNGLEGDRDLLLSSRLGNRVAFSRSIMSGKTAQELSKRSVAAREVDTLKSEIEELLVPEAS